MAELVVQVPDQPEQVLTLADQPVTVGRAGDCTAFIPEPKASRRHLRILRLAGGGFVAEDQGSANGTWVLPAGGGEQRILRRLLVDGDVLRIGDTRLTYRADAATTAGGAPLVSGSLLLVPSEQAPAPSADATAPALAEEAPGGARERPPAEPPRGREPGRQSFVRALVLCAVGAVALVGVEAWLGAQAARKSARKDARTEALRILGHLEDGSTRFGALRDEFASRFPNTPEVRTLDRYLEDLRRREEHALLVNKELETLQGRIDVVPPAESRFRLLQLQRELPGDEEFALRVARVVQGLDRQRAEADLDALRDVERRAEACLDLHRTAQAARVVASFEQVRPSMGAEAHDRWQRLRARVDGLLKTEFETVWAQAEAEPDPARVRALLAAAWPGLAGSAYGDRIADRLASAAAMATPPTGAPVPAGATPGAAPEAPAQPTLSEGLLTRAKDAEARLGARDWAGGRAALAALLGEVPEGLLRAEWTARLEEVDGILGLVRALGEAASEEKKPRRKLSTGTWNVVEVTPEQVVLERSKEGRQAIPWGELPPADVLALLKPTRIRPEERPALAVLAASLGDRDGFVEAMLPLYEKGTDLDAANRLVARHLFGRAAPPEGGYRAYKGELLDTAGYERRQEQERVEFLRTEADRLLALVAKEAAFKKLGRLEAQRTELDKRRRHALLAIFNLKHYPYPANKASQEYQAVQQEIDRRVAAAREIWDDPLQVRVKREGQLAKHLDAWDAAIGELERRHVDVTELRKRAARYTMYVTDEALTIRTFYVSAEEAELLAYNRWVMEQYNPARREVAQDAEWRQVQITNEYRMLMGYAAIVTPGEAPYEAIDRDSVVKILDDGRIDKTSALRAVRIDNRLVTSARGHSEDMSRRGYFAHQAPPNPATGEGPTGPADRMMRQGYRGWSYSENIAQSGNPQQAHDMWCHSSGHHRNILSGWTDLGAGLSGRNFTQNFASGGGGKPEIQSDTSIRERQDARGGGRAPSRGD